MLTSRYLIDYYECPGRTVPEYVRPDKQEAHRLPSVLHGLLPGKEMPGNGLQYDKKFRILQSAILEKAPAHHQTQPTKDQIKGKRNENTINRNYRNADGWHWLSQYRLESFSKETHFRVLVQRQV